MRRISVLFYRAATVVFLISGLALTGCDFGNQTNDTTSQGAEEGTIMEGDNANDASADSTGRTKDDTTGIGSFQ